MNLNNKNDNDASNIVIDNDTIELVVPDTQTQIVDATQYDTESVDGTEAFVFTPINNNNIR